MRLDLRIVGASALLGSTLVLAVLGDPTLDDQLRWRRDVLDRSLDARSVQIDPGELLELMHDNLVRLRIVDVRDEADFNAFHLVDAERVDCEALGTHWGRDLDLDEIVVLTGNDEARAESAWRMLTARGLANVYVLAGGLNRWMQLHGEGTVRPRAHFATASTASTDQASACFEEEPFLWSPPAALGDRHPASLPALDGASPRDFEPKVRRPSAGDRPSGGCG